MISLQFSQCRGLSDALIEYRESSWVTHVDSILPRNDPDGGQLLGARLEGGVAIRPPGYAPFSLILRVDLPCAEAVAAAYYAGLRGELGKPYDKAAIVGFALDRDWRDPGEWICSELSTAKLEACGYFAFPLSAPANRITPADELLLVSSRVPLGAPHPP